jgi:hypothetical protein
LDDAAKRTGKQKNELVLEALEAYLAEEKPRLETFDLGVFEFPSREELYSELEDLHFPLLANDDPPGR